MKADIDPIIDENIDPLVWLQGWYTSQCNDSWEEFYGIKMDTVADPGWHVQIVVTETGLEDKRFAGYVVKRSKQDWIECHLVNTEIDKVQCKVFNVFCGPLNLTEALTIFHYWVMDSVDFDNLAIPKS
jgi:hypothetical protein